MTKKKTLTPEFSRPLIVDRVPRKGSHEVFAAEPAECTELAKRFDLLALHSVKAHLVATPWRGGGLHVTGGFEADLEQVSVVSLEQFRETLKFKVDRYFLPPKVAIDGIEEDADIIDNGEVDLGELVSETIGLELEPYPRKAGEEFASADAPDEVERDPSPFAKLVKPPKDK